MPHATLYNLPPALLPQAQQVAGRLVSATWGTRGYKVTARADSLREAHRVVSAWADAGLLLNGATAHASAERVTIGGQVLAE